jgi:hypothetical protein
LYQKPLALCRVFVTTVVYKNKDKGRVFNYVSKGEECVFYTLKLLKSIFIAVGKIKEAIVGKTFPDGARTTLDL